MNGITNDYTDKVDERPSDEYEKFLEALKDHFNILSKKENAKLFTTNATNLYDIFLDNLPEEARQNYTCRACKNFVERFGGLVFIKENGDVESAIWGKVPLFFTPSVNVIIDKILNSRVTGVFISDNEILGKPITGVWQHISVQLPSHMVSTSRLRNQSQLMAEKAEDYNILISAINKYPVEAVNQAITLLKTDSLYRSEKCLGVAEWFKDIHNKISCINDSRKKNNVLWLAVAMAPTGFCHINSSMIGTLLDDIVDGLPFESVSKRFAEKMSPLQYQRPQARPTVGNIMQAEKIIEKLGIEKSLHRRFAELEELNLLWKQVKRQELKDTTQGVFSHLITKPKVKKGMDIPTVTITWEKFYRTVLPLAKDIEYLVTSGKKNYSAILTAEFDDAPPIIQWDTNERRNPFSHYVYIGGSSFSVWNLNTGYCKVTGICYQPSMWYGNFEHHGKSVHFILNGAKDTNYKHGGSGNALFPEDLKSELREIRSTIEAYSKEEDICGYSDSSACGIRLQSGSEWNEIFKVTTDIGTVLYKIDRWD